MRRDGLSWSAKLLFSGICTVTLTCLMSERAMQAAGKRSDAVVKVAASTGNLDAGGKQTVTITLEVDKGWHIYANPVKNEDLVNIQTVVSINAQTKPADVKILYPAGKLHDKKGEQFFYYDGKVTIQVQVLRAAGDTGPLEATVRFAACDSSSCLLPASKKITLP